MLGCFEGQFHLEITDAHTIYKEYLSPSLKIWSRHIVQRILPRRGLAIFLSLSYHRRSWSAKRLSAQTTLVHYKDKCCWVYLWIALEFPLQKVLHFEFLEFDTDRDLALILTACPNLEDYKVSHVYSSERACFCRFRVKSAHLHVEFGHLRFKYTLSPLFKKEMKFFL